MAGLHATNRLVEAPSFAMGDKIEARYGGGDVFYPGTIGSVNPDAQTCDIVYDDGDGECGVAFSLVRKRGGAATQETTGGATNTVTAKQSQFSVGSQVEVRSFKGDWKPGTITVMRDEGSFDVQLATGELEKGVPPSLVRVPQKQQPKNNEVAGGSGSGSGSGSSSSSGPNSSTASAAVSAAQAALSRTPATKNERLLHDELSVLLQAHQRQLKSVAKNTNTIGSLKTKIEALEAALGPAA